jgi:hypothetical protein
VEGQTEKKGEKIMRRSESYQIPLRIRREYLDQIEDRDESKRKRIEYRPVTPFWYTRLEQFIDPDPHMAALKALKGNLVATFVCHKDIHRRVVIIVERIKTPTNFSSQGKRDVSTPLCYAIELGREIKWCGCPCGCDNEIDNLMEDRCHYCNQYHDYNK